MESVAPAMKWKLTPSCLLFVFLSIVVLTFPASAQIDRDNRSLVDLLNQLGLDEGSVNFGQGDLDETREAAIDAAEERADVRLPNRSALSRRDAVLYARFCRQADVEDLGELLDLVPQVSRLERDYCRRLREPILQSAYDMFDGVVQEATLNTGAASDRIVLGVGDELLVTFVGTDAFTEAVTIDREGRLTTNRLPPIQAAARTLAEVRSEVKSRTQQAFIGIEAFVSLGAIRQISVLVAGEVAKPGFHQLTSLSSIVDALGLAGGIKKTGSLRNVLIRRGDDLISVDLYELAFGFGFDREVTLREGDRIIVPPLRGTVAIAGQVNQPSIVEIAPGEESISVRTALEFAGGTIRPAGYTLLRVSFDASGQEQVVEASEDGSAKSGDIIFVALSRDRKVGAVELAGHVRTPGRKVLSSVRTVAGLLDHGAALGDDVYLLFGVLETIDPLTRARQKFGLNLRPIIDGEEDFILRDGDRLVVLSRDDVSFLSSRSVQSALLPSVAENERQKAIQGDGENVAGQQQTPNLVRLREVSELLQGSQQSDDATGSSDVALPHQSGFARQDCRPVKRLEELVLSTRPSRFAGATLGRTESGSAQLTRRGTVECRDVYNQEEGLLPFVLEHSANLVGEVRLPGVYPIAQETSLGSLIGVAGGLTQQVDHLRTELSARSIDKQTGQGATVRELVSISRDNLASVSVRPGDVVRFNALFSDRESGVVTLDGEFLHPGTYEIRRGERLSELFARAGGLTSQAYPFGAVFVRESVRRAEREALVRLGRELDAALSVAAVTKGIGLDAVRAFSSLGRNVADAPATGRIVVEADPTVLQVRPELDSVLQPGDRIVMPKRPNSVLVTGDVLSPGAKQFVSGTKVSEYIDQAGGFQQSADQGRVFVVFPNGVAQPVSVSPFRSTTVRVPPGSAIVVPKDATPFDLLTFARDISTVLSQLAITAASLAVISDQ